MENKEIRLHPKELEEMILGSLSWTDVAERMGHKRKMAQCKKASQVIIEDTMPLDAGRNSTCSLIKLEGIKVVFLLGGVAFLTLATWVYFVFCC